jgi:hypothetical protein
MKKGKLTQPASPRPQQINGTMMKPVHKYTHTFIHGVGTDARKKIGEFSSAETIFEDLVV